MAAAEAAPREDFAQQTQIVANTRLWTEPNKFGEAMARLKPGLNVDVLEYETGASWARVRTPSGREGWVRVYYTGLSGRKAPKASDKLASDGDEPGDDALAKGKRAKRRPASADEEQQEQEEDFARGFWASAGPAFLLQLKPDTAVGFGADLAVGYRLHRYVSVGAFAAWDTYGKTSTDAASLASVSRRQHHFFFGGLVRGHYENFGVDLTLGYDIVKTNLALTDTNGNALGSIPGTAVVAGDYSEGAFGLGVGPFYSIPIAEKMFLDAWLAFRMGFYGGTGLVPSDSGSTPMQLLAGARFKYQF